MENELKRYRCKLCGQELYACSVCGKTYIWQSNADECCEENKMEGIIDEN